MDAKTEEMVALVKQKPRKGT